jgi:PIN domain nuclease of toxin-antitoxin system
MNLLRDTHIAIWAVVDDPRLSQQARDLMLDEPAPVSSTAAPVPRAPADEPEISPRRRAPP